MKRQKPKLVLPRREFLKIGGAGVLGTIIAASTLDVAGAQRPSVENVKANLHALKMGDFNPNYAAQWSYRLAQALGYLKEVGIDDFEVIQSEQYMPGLIGHSLDVTHSDTDVLLASGLKSKLPIKMISCYRHSEWWIMGVRKGINKPSDLKGGKITGGSLNGRNTLVQKRIVKSLGLDPEKDVQFVPMGGGSDKRLAALINGQIDAASVFPRHKAPLEAAGGKFIYEKVHKTPQESFAALGDWLSKNEDTAYAYIRADIKARQWLFKPENKQKAYEIMIKMGYKIPDQFRNLYQVELDQISPDGGFDNAQVMDEFVKDLATTGTLPGGFDWRKYVDMKYVWAAQQALGLPKRPASL
ncbi:MAG TPA: ABC transporter substrate-binding protein [Burkholderiales bacterium]|nr:ABC transporter substrate-binding protein [Burkholderiales bacterium]